MFIAAVVVSVLFALALAGSARAKLIKDPKIVAGMAAVGVPEGRLWLLATAELAGAVGLVVGLFWWPIGVAAAIGVILYFVGAVGAHVRAKDKNVVPALVMLVVAVAALILRVTTN